MVLILGMEKALIFRRLSSPTYTSTDQSSVLRWRLCRAYVTHMRPAARNLESLLRTTGSSSSFLTLRESEER